MKTLGMELKDVTLPDWPYSSLMPILFAEGAASFEDLALTNQLGSLKVQVKDAWPNLFREARFLSAVDCVQADRFRRKVALEMARIFRDVDVLIVPSLRDEQLTITNFTGHPSLTLRAGFVDVSEARSDWAPTPPTRCRSSRRRGASRTGSLSSAGCSTRESLDAWEWRSNVRSASPRRAPSDSRARPVLMSTLSRRPIPP
jgi:Asp-tRNA(Asn)/Glu-tRNA(Gln) amidotransferase A subunit family amidase